MARVYPLRFGEQGKFELTEAALKHLFVGETTVRPVNALGERTPEVVLSGGLHTWTGWEQLLKEHAGVVHLLEYDVDRHVDWFYARELQNGVITLKIPRRMFTGDAAAITKMPDVNYKSGYLWKTLYPLGYSEDDVIKTLAEALQNLDREDSAPPTAAQPAGVLYGYALLDEPLKSMKLRIQVRGNQIQSALPRMGAAGDRQQWQTLFALRLDKFRNRAIYRASRTPCTRLGQRVPLKSFQC